MTFARALSSQTCMEPINLDTPSPSPSPKRPRVEEVTANPVNPEFPTANSDSDDGLPKVGAAPDELEEELARLIEEDDTMDVATTPER